ncbi:sialate O-acetylesterase [Roseivirga sp. BDSF3-8]|uniref:sialate O-acetylesterase n=1 Tax=Roseivirga sp. BDSF3-8 TaxID=3241598 RepID=UPI003531E55F
MNTRHTPLLLITSILLAFTLGTSCQSSEANQEQKKGTTYHLYFAGGQSNMEGYGYTQDLPEEYRDPQPNVIIYNGTPLPDDNAVSGNDKWMPLAPGLGVGYKATKDSVQLSDRFGPELSFGKRMAELTGENIAIIKYAKGGSSIALGGSPWGTWGKDYQDSTTINQWDHFENTVRLAMQQKDLDNDGIQDTLIPSGIIWMQGEADATREAASASYYENLSTLMNQITAEFGVEELPIVLCRIEESGKTPEDILMPHIQAVYDAQEKFAQEHAHVSLIRLDQPVNFLEDKWHYESPHYIEMGNKFANAMTELQ